ncbi:MAG: metalloregulator ArsR/SmtB family transcription factor [Candidatus Krumholzibacteriota bacterium]|nr:metalloregulator ArsR/SmtB family transcription factor [Candidatus Krumholzibacteriota bacterium]
MKDVENRSAYDIMAKRLKALADSNRLRIIHSICDGEKNVTSLTNEIGLNQASISKHLRILREENLVVSRREHRKIFYSLSDNLPPKICKLVLESLKNSNRSDGDIIDNYSWQSKERGN